MTSHDVVAMGRKALQTRRVGHAGTLDPMATGVLVLGFGIGTRLLQYITDGQKVYTATIVLGVGTHTDDAEGEVISTADVSAIHMDEIKEILGSMVGDILQRPSSVSAIRINGQRAYDLVREGVEVDIPARPVTIYSLDIHNIRHLNKTIEVDIEVCCSAGTFIRAIARDLGQKLNVGGHLSALRRTRVAGFTLDHATSIRDLKEREFHPLSISQVARSTFPVRELALDEVSELSFGRSLTPNLTDEIFAAMAPDDRLIALVRNIEGKAKPIAVFAAAQ